MQSLAYFRGLKTVFITQIEKGAEPFELLLVISVRSFFALQPFQVTNMIKSLKVVRSSYHADPGGGTLGISGWGCAAGTLAPLTYTRASSAEFCYPILE